MVGLDLLVRTSLGWALQAPVVHNSCGEDVESADHGECDLSTTHEDAPFPASDAALWGGAGAAGWCAGGWCTGGGAGGYAPYSVCVFRKSNFSSEDLVKLR